MMLRFLVNFRRWGYLVIKISDLTLPPHAVLTKKLKIIRDKVPPHTSQQIIAKLTDIKYKLLQNPPDLPPTDYHFLKHFELFLGNRHFENEENHKTSIVEVVDLKDQNFFENGIKNSLEKCIETNGAYFD
uniref:Uncharacterized protein n=1 Tax=Vespula pensylvanica TaxID=30213 RepID=A0A834JS72_VESPE|nr:hypothetical protein H0235_017471 [Vespula pensylvanica]